MPSSETLGLEGEVNIQGEDQKKLDVITNDLLKRALRFTGKLGVLASEEEDEPVSRSSTLCVCVSSVCVCLVYIMCNEQTKMYTICAIIIIYIIIM